MKCEPENLLAAKSTSTQGTTAKKAKARVSNRNTTGKGVSYREEESDDDDDEIIKISRRKKPNKEKRRRGRHQQTNGRFPWTPEEDEILRKLVTQHGPKWSVISTLMSGIRTGKQIRDRFVNKLDVCIMEKPWSSEEDSIVIKCWQEFGNRWSEIAKQLSGRTESMVKNRFYSHIKRKRIGKKGRILDEVPAKTKGVKRETAESEQSNDLISSKQSSLTSLNDSVQTAIITQIHSDMNSGILMEQEKEDIFILNKFKSEGEQECPLEEKAQDQPERHQLNFTKPSLEMSANTREGEYHNLTTQWSSEPIKIESTMSTSNLNTPGNNFGGKNECPSTNIGWNNGYLHANFADQSDNFSFSIPHLIKSNPNVVLKRLEDEMLDMEDEAHIERSAFMLEGRAGANDPDMNPYWRVKRSRQALIQGMSTSYQEFTSSNPFTNP